MASEIQMDDKEPQTMTKGEAKFLGAYETAEKYGEPVLKKVEWMNKWPLAVGAVIGLIVWMLFKH